MTRPLLCPLPSQTAEAIRHFLVIQGNGARLSTGRLLLPFRQLGEQPAPSPFGCSDALRDELCPRRAQAEQGLRGCHRLSAFWPAVRLPVGEYLFGWRMLELGNYGVGPF